MKIELHEITVKELFDRYHVLDGDESHLNLRSFTDSQKREAYERQRGICPVCKQHF